MGIIYALNKNSNWSSLEISYSLCLIFAKRYERYSNEILYILFNNPDNSLTILKFEVLILILLDSFVE